MRRKKGFYSISAVAQMFSIHPQTIRFYEQEGLLSPKRTPGGTRMFEEEDIDRLEQVLYFTHELGVNLAGVEVVMKLQRQVKKLQKELNDKFDEVSNELSKRENSAKAVIKEDAHQLMQIKSRIKKGSAKQLPALPGPKSEKKDSAEQLGIPDWEIDYED